LSYRLLPLPVRGMGIKWDTTISIPVTVIPVVARRIRLGAPRIPINPTIRHFVSSTGADLRTITGTTITLTTIM
jgi:hypothetical protein